MSLMRQDDAKESGGDHDLGHYHCRNLCRRNLRDSLGVVAGVIHSRVQRGRRGYAASALVPAHHPRPTTPK